MSLNYSLGQNRKPHVCVVGSAQFGADSNWWNLTEPIVKIYLQLFR